MMALVDGYLFRPEGWLMPLRSLRPCSKCRALYRGKRCPKCSTGWADAHRGNASQRGYGRTWQRLRRRILLRDEYTCRMCGQLRIGSELDVDHRRPKSQGGSDDPRNLQTLCREPCHRLKTERERQGVGG